MAAVKINVGLHGGEQAATVARHQWRDLVEARALHCNSSLRQDCRALVFYIEDAAKNDWIGFGGRDEYIRDGLGLEPDLVAWAVDGLRRLDGRHAVTFDEAVVLGKQGAPLGNDNAKKDRENKPRNTKFESDTASYAVARLRRDAPELADAVKRGELSANAAAIQAGFRKPTWTAPADPERLAAAVSRRFPGWRMVRVD